MSKSRQRIRREQSEHGKVGGTSTRGAASSEEVGEGIKGLKTLEDE